MNSSFFCLLGFKPVELTGAQHYLFLVSEDVGRSPLIAIDGNHYVSGFSLGLAKFATDESAPWHMARSDRRSLSRSWVYCLE